MTFELSLSVSDYSLFSPSHEQVMAAVARLRYSFRDAPIFTRAQSRGDAQELMEAGATEVVVEFDELPRSAKALMSKVEEDNVKMKAFA